MADFKTTSNQIRLLHHMLGAGGRFLKKEWGFRNGYTSAPGSKDHEDLLAMKQAGFVEANGANTWFCATKRGALSIGFKPYQIKKLKFAEDD